MRKRNRVVALALAATMALAASAVAAPQPGETTRVKTTITLGAAGYQGKVKAANPNCIGERIVVLKQKGNGVLSRSESQANGNWKADLDALNENIKIPAMVYSEVKPMTQATAGPIYKCLGAVSRTVEIGGG
jgi:hypothetical protein